MHDVVQVLLVLVPFFEMLELKKRKKRSGTKLTARGSEEKM